LRKNWHHLRVGKRAPFYQPTWAAWPFLFAKPSPTNHADRAKADSNPLADPDQKANDQSRFFPAETLKGADLTWVGVLSLGPRKGIPELWICLPAGLILLLVIQGIVWWATIWLPRHTIVHFALRVEDLGLETKVHGTFFAQLGILKKSRKTDAVRAVFPGGRSAAHCKAGYLWILKHQIPKTPQTNKQSFPRFHEAEQPSAYKASIRI